MLPANLKTMRNSVIGNKVLKKIIDPFLFPLQVRMAQNKITDLLKCLQEMEECNNSLSQESKMLEALIIRKEESNKKKMANLKRKLSKAKERKEQLQRKVKKLKEMKETLEAEE